ESELFGCERGAFTGAVIARTGRFQAADGGTTFLYEISQFPLELQPELLRVIQEQEVQRVRSSATTRVDARVVTATDRDLERLIVARRFRADLAHRLNVSPIQLPSLRERGDGIPLLVEHVVRECGERHGRSIRQIPDAVMGAMLAYRGPGIGRELQNFVE